MPANLIRKWKMRKVTDLRIWEVEISRPVEGTNKDSTQSLHPILRGVKFLRSKLGAPKPCHRGNTTFEQQSERDAALCPFHFMN
jgi:hypothetical protein